MGRMLCSSAPGSASWKDLAIKGLSGLLLMGGGGAGGFLIKGYLDLHKTVDDNDKRIVGRLTAIDINQATMKVEMATLKQDVATLNTNMAIMMESLCAIRVFTFSSVGQSILSLFFILKHCLVIINHVSREVHLSTDYSSFTTLL